MQVFHRAWWSGGSKCSFIWTLNSRSISCHRRSRRVGSTYNETSRWNANVPTRSDTSWSQRHLGHLMLHRTHFLCYKTLWMNDASYGDIRIYEITGSWSTNQNFTRKNLTFDIDKCWFAIIETSGRSRGINLVNRQTGVRTFREASSSLSRNRDSGDSAVRYRRSREVSSILRYRAQIALGVYNLRPYLTRALWLRASSEGKCSRSAVSVAIVGE